MRDFGTQPLPSAREAPSRVRCRGSANGLGRYIESGPPPPDHSPRQQSARPGWKCCGRPDTGVARCSINHIDGLLRAAIFRGDLSAGGVATSAHHQCFTNLWLFDVTCVMTLACLVPGVFPLIGAESRSPARSSIAVAPGLDAERGVQGIDRWRSASRSKSQSLVSCRMASLPINRSPSSVSISSSPCLLM